MGGALRSGGLLLIRGDYAYAEELEILSGL